MNVNDQLTSDQKKRYRIANISMIAAALIVLAIALNQTVFKEESLSKRVVKQEDIYCISAVCIIEGSTTKCMEINPSISHMIISEDPQVKQSYRLVVNPTDKVCGLNTYLSLEKESIEPTETDETSEN